MANKNAPLGDVILIYGSVTGGRRPSKISKSSEKLIFEERSTKCKYCLSFVLTLILTKKFSLDRQEAEFVDKRSYDDFLELREELVMNLVFRTDVAATNRRLKEYAQANGIKSDATDSANDLGAKAIKRKDTDDADPSGLIKGLKKIIKPKVKAPYDPFMGMARTQDYYQVKDSYIARLRQGKANDVKHASGYSDWEYVNECLNRAFAGLGVFVEDEVSSKNNTAIPLPAVVAAKPADDVF